jgi:CheY-like chemotaxis protein
VINGDTLFEWLTQNVNSLPDIILSDLNMPGKNGYDVIKEVKSNPLYSHIPVVITSTSSTRTIMEKCITAGASEYIVKPETFVEYVPYVKDLYNRVEEKQLVK